METTVTTKAEPSLGTDESKETVSTAVVTPSSSTITTGISSSQPQQSSTTSSSSSSSSVTNTTATGVPNPTNSSSAKSTTVTNPKPSGTSAFSSLTSGISLRGVGAAVLSFASVPQAAQPYQPIPSTSTGTTNQLSSIASPSTNPSQQRSNNSLSASSSTVSGGNNTLLNSTTITTVQRNPPPTLINNGTTTTTTPSGTNNTLPTATTGRTIVPPPILSNTATASTITTEVSAISTATPTKINPHPSSAVPVSIIHTTTPSSSLTTIPATSSNTSSSSLSSSASLTSPPVSTSSLTGGAFGRLTSLVSVPSLSMSSFTTPPPTNPPPPSSTAVTNNSNNNPRTPGTTNRPIGNNNTTRSALTSTNTNVSTPSNGSSSTSSSSSSSLPIALLARLADLDLIQLNSGVLKATCAGSDLTALVNEGLCRMLWFRVHTLRDIDTQQPIGFRWEPLHNLRSNIYYPSIDDAGCRLLCKARATSTGRAILRQQGYTSVVGNSYGMAECPSVTLDANIGNIAHASFESGGAYFATECFSFHIRVTNKITGTVFMDTLSTDVQISTPIETSLSLDRFKPKSNIDVTVDANSMQLSGTPNDSSGTNSRPLQYTITLPSSLLFIRIDPAVTNQIIIVWEDTKLHNEDTVYHVQYTLRLTTHTTDERNTIAATLRLFNHMLATGSILTDPFITSQWLEAPEGDGDTSDEEPSNKINTVTKTKSSPSSLVRDNETKIGTETLLLLSKTEANDTTAVETITETGSSAQPVTLSLTDFLTAPLTSLPEERNELSVVNHPGSDDDEIDGNEIVKTDFAALVPAQESSADYTIDNLSDAMSSTIGNDSATDERKTVDKTDEGMIVPEKSVEDTGVVDTVKKIKIRTEAETTPELVLTSTLITTTVTDEVSVPTTSGRESSITLTTETITEIELLPENSVKEGTDTVIVESVTEPEVSSTDSTQVHGIETDVLSKETIAPSPIDAMDNSMSPSGTVPSSIVENMDTLTESVEPSPGHNTTEETSIGTHSNNVPIVSITTNDTPVIEIPLLSILPTPPEVLPETIPETRTESVEERYPNNIILMMDESFPSTVASVPETNQTLHNDQTDESTVPKDSISSSDHEASTTFETVVETSANQSIPMITIETLEANVVRTDILTESTEVMNANEPSECRNESVSTESATPIRTLNPETVPVNETVQEPESIPSSSETTSEQQETVVDTIDTIVLSASDQSIVPDSATASFLPVVSTTDSETVVSSDPPSSSSSSSPPVSFVGYVKQEEYQSALNQVNDARKMIELQRTTVTRLQKEASERENRLHSLEQTVSSLTKERNEKDKAVEKAIEDKRKGITAAVEEAKRSIAAGKEDQRKQFVAAQEETKKLQDEMKKLQEDHKKVVTQLQDEKKRLLDEAKRMMVTDHENHKKALAAAQDETKKVQEEHKKTLVQVQEDHKKALQQLHDEIRRVNERNANLTTEVTNTNKRISTVTEEYEQTKSELKKVQAATKGMQTLQTQITVAKTETDELQKQLSTERLTVEKQKEDIQRLQSEVNTLTVTLQETRNHVETVTFESNRYREEIRELHAQLSAASVAGAASEAAATRAQDAASASQAEVVSLRAERDDLRSTLTVTLQRYETLKKEEQERIQRETVEKVNTSRSQAHINELESLKERVAQLSRALEGTAADRAEAVHTAEQAEVKYQQANQRMQALEAEVRRLANSQEVVKAAERSCAEMKEIVDKAIMERNSAMKKFESIRQEMARVMGGESGESLKRINIDELKRAKEGLDGKVVKLIEENAQLRDELEQYKNNRESSTNTPSSIHRKPLNLLSSSSHEPTIPGSTVSSSGSNNLQSTMTPVRPKEGFTNTNSNNFTKPSTPSSSFLSPPPPTTVSRSGGNALSTNTMGSMNSPSGTSNSSSSSTNNSNATIMVNTLQNIIATLTAEMQDKEIAIEQQRQAKEQLGATIMQQLSIIQQLEEKLRKFEHDQSSSSEKTTVANEEIETVTRSTE